jgi:hypothetical protein
MAVTRVCAAFRARVPSPLGELDRSLLRRQKKPALNAEGLDKTIMNPAK